jgi:hypothetical protein
MRSLDVEETVMSDDRAVEAESLATDEALPAPRLQLGVPQVL